MEFLKLVIVMKLLSRVVCRIVHFSVGKGFEKWSSQVRGLGHLFLSSKYGHQGTFKQRRKSLV